MKKVLAIPLLIFFLSIVSVAFSCAEEATIESSTASTWKTFCNLETRNYSASELADIKLRAANNEVSAECDLAKHYLQTGDFKNAYTYFALNILDGAEEDLLPIATVSNKLSQQERDDAKKEAINLMPSTVTTGEKADDCCNFNTDENFKNLLSKANAGDFTIADRLAELYMHGERTDFAEAYFWLRILQKYRKSDPFPELNTPNLPNSYTQSQISLKYIAAQLSLREMIWLNRRVHAWEPPKFKN